MTAEEMPDFVAVQVKDYGCGMTPDDLSKLFDMNEVKNIGTGKNKGIGLGLALCNDFIKKHDGEIKVSSEPGKGTTIRFTLNKCR
jgi:signal transduction histidine kinase